MKVLQDYKCQLTNILLQSRQNLCANFTILWSQVHNLVVTTENKSYVKKRKLLNKKIQTQCGPTNYKTDG